VILGITTWSLGSPVVALLVARWVRAYPADRLHVLRIRRPIWRVARDALDKYGARGLVSQVAGRLGWRGSGPDPEAVAVAAELDAVARSHDLAGWRTVLTNPPPAVRVHTFRRLDDPRLSARVRREGMEVVVNGGGGIFRRALLDQVPGGVLNPHAGPLPRYRGMNAVEWAVFHGDRPCVTVHSVDTGIDTGDIIRSRPVEVRAEDTIPALRARSYAVAVEALFGVLADLRAGRAARVPQSRDAGRQHYVMHPRLLAIAERRIARLAGGGA
jgi:folate-dependent phosphoribosylglycinamide formyltransferase PurN